MNPWDTSARQHMPIEDLETFSSGSGAKSSEIISGGGFVVDPRRAEDLIQDLRAFKLEVRMQLL